MTAAPEGREIEDGFDQKKLHSGVEAHNALIVDVGHPISRS
jgi:hypothetical protein